MSLRRIHKVPLERSRHCLSPVFVSNVLRSVPHFVSCSVTIPVCVVSLLSCQIFLNPLSLLPRFLRRDLKRDSSCEVIALMPIPPRLVGSFIVVQSSSPSALSSNFSHMHFILVSNVSARGFIFLDVTTFASKSKALGHEPQSLRFPRVPNATV